MREVILGLSMLLSVSAAAGAQSLSAGVGIGRGCAGDSSGFCGDEAGPMWSAHSSAWIKDRLEVGVRVALLPLPDQQYFVARDDRFNLVSDPTVRELTQIDVDSNRRSRYILSGEVLYHFRQGHTVRPFVGGGFGIMSNQLTQTCLPAGCELLMPILSSPVGRLASHSGNVTFTAGASAPIVKNVQLRVGLRLHNPSGEGLSTTEAFVETDWRFRFR